MATLEVEEENHVVANVSQISDKLEEQPFIVKIKDHTVGIYKFRDRYYAYENICSHEGGPILEGKILGDIECKVSPNGTLLGEAASNDRILLACPWHGVCYDLETGICRADKRIRLSSFQVLVEGEKVIVKV